jgi:hypothetical protein
MTIPGDIASQIRNPNPNPIRHTGHFPSQVPFPPGPEQMSHRPFFSETAKIEASSPVADLFGPLDPDGRINGVEVGCPDVILSSLRSAQRRAASLAAAVQALEAALARLAAQPAAAHGGDTVQRTF